MVVFNLVYEFYARRTPPHYMCSLVNQLSRHSLSRVTCTRKGCRPYSLSTYLPSGGAMCKLHYRNFPSVREGCSKYFTIDRLKGEKPTSIGQPRQIEADAALPACVTIGQRWNSKRSFKEFISRYKVTSRLMWYDRAFNGKQSYHDIALLEKLHLKTRR